MNVQDPSVVKDVSHEYRKYGDFLPDNQRLGEFESRLSGQTTPGASLLLADIYIDTARHELENPDAPLALAKDALTSVIESVRWLKERGYDKSVDDLTTVAIRAELKFAEIKPWSDAIKDNRVELDYEELVEAALRASGLVDRTGKTPKAEPTIAEFVPLLLGARGEYLEPGMGWTGRLALQREDRRIRPNQTSRNWDIGIATSEKPESYIDPEIKIDVSKSKKKGVLAQTEAGIMNLRADRLGFSDTAAVIADCACELEDIDSDHEGPETERLDEIADRIRDRIEHAPKKDIRRD